MNADAATFPRAGGWFGRWWRVVLVCVVAWGGEVARGAERVWTIASYNVENYTVADRLVAGRYVKGYPKPETAKAALRAVIRRIDADVLALQEVGGEDYLRELQRDLASDGVTYAHAVLLEAADADRRVAVLSKTPLADVVRHVDVSFTYFGEKTPVKRGLLEVTLSSPGGGPSLRVFVVHLKSRYAERPDDPLSATRRAGEATALRNRVLERCPEPEVEPFLVVGDFNDAANARPVRAFLERGERVVTRCLPMVDSRGEGWTHRYAKEESYTRVDHVLVSPAAQPWVERGWIEDGDGVREASDHRPVVVRLRVSAP